MAIQLKGKKIGMTHIWKEDKMIPVTVIQVPTATVIEKRNQKARLSSHSSRFKCH